MTSEYGRKINKHNKNPRNTCRLTLRVLFYVIKAIGECLLFTR